MIGIIKEYLILEQVAKKSLAFFKGFLCEKLIRIFKSKHIHFKPLKFLVICGIV